MIPLRDQEYIRQLFAQSMEGRVRIEFFTQQASRLLVPGREECATCDDTGKLLEELAALSDKITLTTRELAAAPDEAKKFKVDKVPGIVIRSSANRTLRFFGAPAGNEFTTFVETIVFASRQQAELSEDAARHLKRLRDDVSVTVYVTPTCSYCPQTVRAAFRLGLASARIEASVVEINEFPALARRLGVRSVPLTVLNGDAALLGALDETTLARAVLTHAEGKVITHASDETTGVAPAEAEHEAPPSGLIIPR